MKTRHVRVGMYPRIITGRREVGVSELGFALLAPQRKYRFSNVYLRPAKNGQKKALQVQRQ
jgi:hypothetical protein